MVGELERETGIEPATSSLGSWRSTAELLPLGRQSDFSSCGDPDKSPSEQLQNQLPIVFWLGNSEVRTAGRGLSNAASRGVQRLVQPRPAGLQVKRWSHVSFFRYGKD